MEKNTWNGRLSHPPSEPAYYIVDCRIFDFMALNWMVHNFTGCENVLCTWHYRCRIFCFNQFYATLWLYLTSKTIVLWTIILSQWKSLRQNALSRHLAKHIWWWHKWKSLPFKRSVNFKMSFWCHQISQKTN